MRVDRGHRAEARDGAEEVGQVRLGYLQVEKAGFCIGGVGQRLARRAAFAEVGSALLEVGRRVQQDVDIRRVRVLRVEGRVRVLPGRVLDACLVAGGKPRTLRAREHPGVRLGLQMGVDANSVSSNRQGLSRKVNESKNRRAFSPSTASFVFPVQTTKYVREPALTAQKRQ